MNTPLPSALRLLATFALALPLLVTACSDADEGAEDTALDTADTVAPDAADADDADTAETDTDAGDAADAADADTDAVADTADADADADPLLPSPFRSLRPRRHAGHHSSTAGRRHGPAASHTPRHNTTEVGADGIEPPTACL